MTIFIFAFSKIMEEMNDAHIHEILISKLRQEHAFWSYENIDTSKISDDELIARVLLHLDIDDIFELFKIYPKRTIQKVWKDKLVAQDPMYHGLNRLYAILFFKIKRPDRYISDFKNKRSKSLICKV
jgi:hypothetical protein